MKIKTSELSGAALDWAVAKCEERPHSYAVADIKGQAPLKAAVFTPSTDWAQGGPIVEREKIETWYRVGVQWAACIPGVWEETGPTNLIAAMRCYVGSRLGNEVEVPDELTQNAKA